MATSSDSAAVVSFDATMLLCHLASSLLLALHFAGAASAATTLTRETLLLGLKTVAELLHRRFTQDLAFHHLGMLIGYALSRAYPEQAFLLVHMQVIHVALAINYLRRVMALPSFDKIFVLSWILAVVARNAMAITYAAESWLVNRAFFRIMLAPLLLMVGLDILWTREVIGKRPWPRGSALAAAFGTWLGFSSSGSAGAILDGVRLAWLAISTAPVTLVIAWRLKHLTARALTCVPSKAATRSESRTDTLCGDGTS